MPDMTLQKNKKQSGSTVLYLELAVPVLSFGGAFLALFFSEMGSIIDVRYFAIGCVISSFVLAYLAWIRPRKDIVALSTPIYAVIFFIAPSDMAVNLVLEFLYAVSITILLLRLKYRFGSAPVTGIAAGGKTLEEPLKGYCACLEEKFSGVSPSVSHFAAVGFIRFAQGDYGDVADAADAAMAELTVASVPPALLAAFDIAREQARLLDESADPPEDFRDFSTSDAGILAKPLPPEDKRRDRYEVSLENALLLLFAVAWNASQRDHPLLLTGQSFALKLFTA